MLCIDNPPVALDLGAVGDRDIPVVVIVVIGVFAVRCVLCVPVVWVCFSAKLELPSELLAT